VSDEPTEPEGKPTTLLLREEIPDLTLTAMRLDDEAARMQAR
jgi:hypothetical protein